MRRHNASDATLDLVLAGVFFALLVAAYCLFALAWLGICYWLGTSVYAAAQRIGWPLALLTSSAGLATGAGIAKMTINRVTTGRWRG